MAGGGGGEDCKDGTRPVRRGKGAGRGWQVVLLACCLCSAAQPDKSEGEQGQGEYKHGNAGMMKWRNTDISQLMTDEDKENDMDKKRDNGQKKQRKTLGKALAHWCSRFFKKKAAPDTGNKWRWGVVLSEEERLRQRQEALRRERACLEAYRLQQEKERDRQVMNRNIHRKRRTVEANNLWSSLPLRAEDAARAVTFREPTPFNMCTRNNKRKLSQRELEWRRTVEEVRKAEMEKKMAESMRKKMTWLTFLKGDSPKEDLILLVMAFAIFLIPKISAITFSLYTLSKLQL
ncbi:hypothetical protein ACEWY4_016617 [Coilia grayii]|uniref:Uncharacterized protein n=1 Tax=Coilia grayii TaxID=363190 RepID=A0ABD1JLW2_9TELE